MDDYAGLVQDRLRKNGFPVNASKEIKQVAFHSSGSSRAETHQQWEFRDKGEHWGVFLHNNFVTLQTTNYEGFEEFLARLLAVLSTVNDEVEGLLIERVGLRYVNAIPGEVWKKYIDSGFHGIELAAFEQSTALQIHQTAAFTDAGKIMIRLLQNREGQRLPPDLAQLELQIPERFDSVDGNTLWTIVDVDHFAIFAREQRFEFDPDKLADNAWKLKNIMNDVTFENLFTKTAIKAWS